MRRALLIGLCLFLFNSRAMGHDLLTSAIALDFDRDAVSAELVLPMDALATASHLPLMGKPERAAAQFQKELRAYILARVQPTTAEGIKWSVELIGMEAVTRQEKPDLVVRLRLRPPPGATQRRFTFLYSVICREVRSHAALISVRNDWNNAVFSMQPKLLGVVQSPVELLTVDRTHGSFWEGFGTVLTLGIRHIAEGLDHLMFLFTLLLPAPLLAVGHRWRATRGFRGSVGQLLKIVTAFTLGHSLTLVVGGLGWVSVPRQPVEVLIAVTILVSALHTLRPLFAGWEPLVAGCFGLIHGLAFASSIAEYGFSPWYLGMTVLGFNLGIELVQIGLVLAVVPSMLSLSRTWYYTPVRVAGAVLAAVASGFWIGARLQLWTSFGI